LAGGSVQAQTWLVTYPNPELGITREGLRRYREGEDGERIAERIARARQRLLAQAIDGVVMPELEMVRRSVARGCDMPV
jgi:hypothetical protein